MFPDSVDTLAAASTSPSGPISLSPAPSLDALRDVRADGHAATATVTAMTYNILAGGGPRLGDIEQVIRHAGADVVGLQEVLRPDLLVMLAERLGMHYALAPGADGWHVGALSRWPILESRPYTGPRMARGLLETLIELPGGRRMRFFATHLSARFMERRAGEMRRLRELDFVLSRTEAARDAGEPHLLVGDLNSMPPGERFDAMQVMRHALAVDVARRAKDQRMAGHPGVDNVLPPIARPFRPVLAAASRVALLAWACNVVAGAYMPREVVRRIGASGYTDCYVAAHPDARTRAFTCPQPAPGGRIDYIFASPELAPRLIGCEILTDAPASPVTRASDHRPVVARFTLDA